jgi:hypothetical protein
MKLRSIKRAGPTYPGHEKYIQNVSENNKGKDHQRDFGLIVELRIMSKLIFKKRSVRIRAG